jgi:hypothetical protein
VVKNRKREQTKEEMALLCLQAKWTVEVQMHKEDK